MQGFRHLKAIERDSLGRENAPDEKSTGAFCLVSTLLDGPGYLVLRSLRLRLERRQQAKLPQQRHISVETPELGDLARAEAEQLDAGHHHPGAGGRAAQEGAGAPLTRRTIALD